MTMTKLRPPLLSCGGQWPRRWRSPFAAWVVDVIYEKNRTFIYLMKVVASSLTFPPSSWPATYEHDSQGAQPSVPDLHLGQDGGDEALQSFHLKRTQTLFLLRPLQRHGEHLPSQLQHLLRLLGWWGSPQRVGVGETHLRLPLLPHRDILSIIFLCSIRNVASAALLQGPRCSPWRPVRVELQAKF